MNKMRILGLPGDVQPECSIWPEDTKIACGCWNQSWGLGDQGNGCGRAMYHSDI